MNQIVPVEQQTKAALVAGGAPRAIVPNDFEAVWRLSGVLLASGMVPSDFDSQEKIAVVCMHGLEVGLSPMMALQSIALINKRPSIWGDGALGLVQSSGLYEWHKETISGEGDARTAVCIFKRKGVPETYKGEFSVTNARIARLWGKPGPWTQYSDRMLQMRARGFALRDGFSDVLKGLAIAEEMRDVEIVKEPVAPPAPPPAPPPPVLQIESTVAAPEPETPPAPEPEAQQAPEPPAPEQPPEWSFTDYIAGLDKVLAIAKTEDELKAAWKGREQPTRKLVTAEITEMTGLLDKHKARIADAKPAEESAPPEPPVPEPPAPDQGGEPATHAAALAVLDQARAKAKEGLKRFNFWVGKLTHDQFEDLEPHLDQLRAEADKVQVGA